MNDYLATSFQTKSLIEIKIAIITQMTSPMVEALKEKRLAPSLAISLKEETTELSGKE